MKNREALVVLKQMKKKYNETQAGFDALDIAIDAVEKNIGKNPITEADDLLDCPNCGCFIGYQSECTDENYQHNCCSTCGQKIDWSKWQ